MGRFHIQLRLTPEGFELKRVRNHQLELNGFMGTMGPFSTENVYLFILKGEGTVQYPNGFKSIPDSIANGFF